MNSFIEQRLKTNTVSFWDAIPNLKINTFSSMTKKTTIKSTNLKLVTLTEDRNLFGRRPAGQRERDPLLWAFNSSIRSGAQRRYSQEDHQKPSTPDSGKLCDCRTTAGLPSKHANSSNFRCYGTSAKPKICWSNDLRRNGNQVLWINHSSLSTKVPSIGCSIWSLLAAVHQGRWTAETRQGKRVRSADPWCIHTSPQAVSKVYIWMLCRVALGTQIVEQRINSEV